MSETHTLSLMKDGGLWRSRCSCGWRSLICRSKGAAERSKFYHGGSTVPTVTSKRSRRPAALRRAPGARRAALYVSAGEAALDTLARTRKAPTAQTRAADKARREEAAVKAVVREACVERDGYCRLALRGAPWRWTTDPAPLGPCGGASEWAHIGAFKRFKTRNQAPTRRHTTAGSLMFCAEHHHAYDAGRLTIHGGAAGADGLLRYARGGVTYEEAA